MFFLEAYLPRSQVRLLGRAGHFLAIPPRDKLSSADFFLNFSIP